jgi:hypothetical protein
MSPGPIGLVEVHRMLADGEATPREILEMCVARLPEAQAAGAFVVVDEAGARRAPPRGVAVPPAARSTACPSRSRT